MNSLLGLGRCLGDVSTPAFQRHYQNQLIHSLDWCENTRFRYAPPSAQHALQTGNGPQSSSPSVPGVAHRSGTNCLTIDPQSSRYLVTGGADSTIRLWDLSSTVPGERSDGQKAYEPVAALTRADPHAQSHALTSVSIYPFDPSPTTVISTSYDNTILLSSITPTSLQAIHKSSLDFTPHVHAVSPHPSSSPLVAIGTTHPAVRLLDLRTGLSTHSLPGHNGAVYALSFLPSSQNSHVLVSGAVDGRILLFDIRRANPAFASLDLDDAVGVSGSPFAEPSESRSPNLQLNFKAQAHTGPVTGLVPTASGHHLVSAGHDSRIRVWDLATGRNELVHFGPRIRNFRNGNLQPLLAPNGFGKPGQEMMFWPNDDGRGEIFIQSVREGSMLKVLRTPRVDRSNAPKKGATNSKVTNAGRISALACRYGGVDAAGDTSFELYSAHGDGGVGVWKAMVPHDQDAELHSQVHTDDDSEDQHIAQAQTKPILAQNEITNAEQGRKKRKRDLIGDLVEGLTKRPVTFS